MKRFPAVAVSSLPPQRLRTEESPRYRNPLRDEHWVLLLAEITDQLARLPQQAVRSWVGQIRDGIQWLDGIMTEYCRQTCSTCEDPCCTAKGVFFNLADILYLTACRTPPPPGQTRTHGSAPCRYLGANGCRLERIQRPYVCIWFLCDAQMEILLNEPPARQREFSLVLQRIRSARSHLEALYEFHYPPLPEAFPIVFA